MPDLTKEQRRALMPLCTEFIDDIRKHFGEPNAITAKENGQSVIWRKGANEPSAN